MGKCIAPKCGRQAHGSECSGHRRRRERTGSWGDTPIQDIRPRGLTLSEALTWYGWEVLPSGCWAWSGQRNDEGYGQFFYKGRMVRAHRVAYETFNGEIPAGLMVRHECDNPPCVNPAHLVTGTNLENMQDKVARNRQATGESNPKAKMTEAQVACIKGSSDTHASLARRFGVGENAIRKIRSGQTWGWVKAEEARR